MLARASDRRSPSRGSHQIGWRSQNRFKRDVSLIVPDEAQPFGSPNQRSSLWPDQLLAHRLSSAIFFDTGQLFCRSRCTSHTCLTLSGLSPKATCLLLSCNFVSFHGGIFAITDRWFACRTMDIAPAKFGKHHGPRCLEVT
jgi:hypothetical protein